MSRVYVSLPLSGPSGAIGRDVLHGVDLAVERSPGAVDLVVADVGGRGGAEGSCRAFAGRAAADPSAVAYVGDLHSSDVLATQPVLGPARVLQVAPAATFAGLDGPTLVRLTPDDTVLARDVAGWLVDAGVRRLLIVHDLDEYGISVSAMCIEAAEERGVGVRVRPVWNHDEPPGPDLGDAQAVLYVGVAGAGAVELFETLHHAEPGLWLLGTDGVAAPWLAARLGPAAAERVRFFQARRAAWEGYGFEAMSLVLDALEAGGDDRAAVAAAARSTAERSSVIGRYAIDHDGTTTQQACARLRIVDGALAWCR